jgi:UDP-N-acetylglucosamine 4,6-dehydratase
MGLRRSLDLKMFNNSSILITGGTGSIGQALVSLLLERSKARRIIIFSRDELKQYEMRNRFKDSERLRWFLGDVRDLDRLRLAFVNVDYVIHAAALKQVDTGEFNPGEFIKTNIFGSQNVIQSAIDVGVKKVVALSTDKASSPINLYGATKLTADKLFIAANNYGISQGTSFSVVRYGNVLGSRGSVMPYFRSLGDSTGRIPITDFAMTRFWITLNHAARFVLDSLELSQGGELFVPRIPSMKIVDFAKAICPGAELYEIGLRPGEKLHEEMISKEDSHRAVLNQDGTRFTICPNFATWPFTAPKGSFPLKGKAYSSDGNDLWLTKESLLSLLENE